MIGSLIVALLVLVLIFFVLNRIELDPSVRQIINIVVAIGAILWLLKIFGINF